MLYKQGNLYAQAAIFEIGAHLVLDSCHFLDNRSFYKNNIQIKVI